jgi:hypothetical protein
MPVNVNPALAVSAIPQTPVASKVGKVKKETEKEIANEIEIGMNQIILVLEVVEIQLQRVQELPQQM